MDNQQSILLIGNGRLAYSVYICILNSGHPVQFFTEDHAAALERINLHLADLKINTVGPIHCHDLTDIHRDSKAEYNLAIVITPENLDKKKEFIQIAEQYISPASILAVNTESIALSTIQQDTAFPQRIIGANWTEPAHTSFFLEVITNHYNPKNLADEFCKFAKHSLHKDPYVLKNDYGIRTRMLCAMIREAFYLVENGYVSIEDIDRACRNDAGYYLPFAGNFRYMDLMGTFMYGIVMKGLNPELSKDCKVPSFFKNILQQGGAGMKNNLGFYEYQPGETSQWDEISRAFGYQVKEIILKYTVKENDEKMPVTKLIPSSYE